MTVKTRIPISLFACLCIAATSYAQGHVRFTFEGPPLQLPGTATVTTQYYESGFLFRPVAGSPSFVRVGNPPTSQSGRPDNGTAYLQAAVTQSLMFNPTNGSLFGVVSVDLAEYSTGFQVPLTVSFLGYRFDGSVVTTNFTTDGIIDGTGPINDFQTFYFGSEFNNLSRVEIPTSLWSLDNLTISQIPEPTTTALLLFGGALFAAFRFRKRKN